MQEDVFKCCSCHPSWQEHLNDIEKNDGKAVASTINSLLNQSAHEILKELENDND